MSGLDFPAYWDWDKDGLRCEGALVRVEQGQSVHGPVAIAVLDVDGTERSLWLNATALRSKFRDELARRRARRFTPGERIVVERAPEKRVGASGYAYWPFRVRFPEGPDLDDADLLGLDAAEEVGDDDVDEITL